MDVPIYITLMNLTEKGIKNIKNAPKRIEAGLKMLEAMGAKLIGFYVTLGEYDYVGIAEAPNEEVVMRFLLALGASGNVRTTTLKAFTRKEFAGIIEKLP